MDLNWWLKGRFEIAAFRLHTLNSIGSAFNERTKFPIMHDLITPLHRHMKLVRGGGWT